MSNVLMISISRSWLLSLRQLASYSQNDSDINKKINFILFERQLFNYDETTLILDIYKELHKNSVEVVCLSAYIWNREILELVAEKIKKFNKDILIIWGGPEFITDLPNQKEHLYDAISYGVDGEESFLNFFKKYLNGTHRETLGFAFYSDVEGKFVKNSVCPAKIKVDLLYESYIRFPLDYDHYDPNGSCELDYEIMRGCDQYCSFCTWYLHKKFTKDPERCAYELNHLISSIPKNFRERLHIDFTDSISDSDLHIQTVMKIDRSFQGYIAILLSESPNYDILKLIDNYKISVDVGIQSLNDSSLRYLKRNPHDLPKTYQLIDNLNKTKLHLGNIHLMLGLPRHNYDDHMKELDFFQNKIGWRMYCSILSILPGTALKKTVDKDNYVYSKKAPYQIIETPDFSKEEVIKLKNIVDNHYHHTSSLFESVSSFQEYVDHNKKNPYTFNTNPLLRK